MSKVNNQVSKVELEEKLSNVLMRQTNYNKEESIAKLRDNNYNVKKIILDYMKIDISTVAPKNTTSQQRFKDIRNLLK
jgi:hypothetical protein